MTRLSAAMIDAAARPPEIEEPLNRLFIHPVSVMLLRPAIAVGVHPNMVSLSGIGFGVLAAWAYLDWRDPARVLLAYAAMLGWHIFDGVDGKLARSTGKSSDFGRFLDGFCDYSVYILVYVALAWASAPELGMGTAFALAIVAGAAHAATAAHYEAERETYIRRKGGKAAAPGPARIAGGWINRLYTRGQEKLTRGRAATDAALAERPQRHALYLQRAAAILRRGNILGASARTTGIALACLAGSPAYYWLCEIFGLGAASIWLYRRLRRAEAVSIREGSLPARGGDAR